MKICTLILSLILINSCGNTQASVNAKQNMSSQNIESLSGTYNIITLGDRTNFPEVLSIEFDNETKVFSGFSGCNRFSGTYETTDNTIKFGALVSTKKACQEKRNNLEQHVFKALEDVNTFTIENDDTLSLEKDNTVLITATQEKVISITEGDDFSIEYSARTRGTHKVATFQKGTVSLQKDRTSEPETRTCSKAELDSISNYLNLINLNKLSKLDPPSTKHRYDGALMGKLTIRYKDEEYITPIFDHGDPNVYISNLVTTLISIADLQL